MRVLVLCAVYAPDQIGGAEVSAQNLVRFLVAQGHQVAVLTTARRPEEARWGDAHEGVRIYRIWQPRPYALMDYARAGVWQKLVWHAQDYLDPRNRWVLRRVLADFQAEFVNVHVLQGLGFNMLPELARSRLPVMHVLPDASLMCVKTTMFARGRVCPRPCRPMCAATAWLKNRWLGQFGRLGFCAPSAANLALVQAHVPAARNRPGVVRLNANAYPIPSRARPANPRQGPLRLLFVGRLDEAKGLAFLLRVVEEINTHSGPCVQLRVLGTGPLEDALRRCYGASGWCHFDGQVPQTEVANAMAEAEVLCVPSLWAEPSSGVVVQALSLGLPVVASRQGGLVELVADGRTGRLLPAGDAAIWREALTHLALAPEQLAAWRAQACGEAERFAPAALGQALLDWMHMIAHGITPEKGRLAPGQPLGVRVQLEGDATA